MCKNALQSAQGLILQTLSQGFKRIGTIAVSKVTRMCMCLLIPHSGTSSGRASAVPCHNALLFAVDYMLLSLIPKNKTKGHHLMHISLIFSKDVSVVMKSRRLTHQKNLPDVKQGPDSE